MKALTTLAFALTLAITGCKKKEEAPPATPTAGSADTAGSAAVGSGSGSAGSAAVVEAPKETPPPAADPAAEYISVFASHAEKKPGDPVEVKFQKFTVKKAAFDPKNLEGGTATIEIDLASLSSGSEKRDGHLKTPDYIDVAKFTTATVDVANVKKKDDTHYTAEAKVNFHGAEKTYPIEFEVVETGADSVKIKTAQKFQRADFNLGKPEPGADESVAKELELKAQLTLKKT